MFLILFIVVFLLTFGLIQYLNHRDQEKMPWGIGMIVTLLISLLITLPLIGIIFVAYAFFDIGASLHLVDFTSNDKTIAYIIAIIISLFVIESIIQPILLGIIKHFLQKDLFFWQKQFLVIITNTILIYMIGELISGVTINGIVGALGLALLYQCIEWIVLICKKYIVKNKAT